MRQQILPLPKGEGRGEGEESENHNKSVVMFPVVKHPRLAYGLVLPTFPFPSPCLHRRSHFRKAKTCPSPVGRGELSRRAGEFFAR